jgi:nucleoid DNA-binding protein
MTKRELVIRVANELGMTQSDVAKVIEGTFDCISQNLAEGNRWELRDFGVFEVKTRASRIGRNPRTGDQVPVPERRVVTFRPGKKMKELVANGIETPEQPGYDAGAPGGYGHHEPITRPEQPGPGHAQPPTPPHQEPPEPHQPF